MSHYTFTGRILPEQVTVSLGRYTNKLQLSESAVPCEMTFTIASSIVVAEVETGFSDVETLRNHVEYGVNGIVSMWGFAMGLYLTTNITAAYDSDRRITHQFVGPKPDLAFSETQAIADHLFHAFIATPSLNGFMIRALADYNQAILIPHDTGFYCYRAIEALSQTFHSDGIRDKVKWQHFREALNIEEDYIKWLTDFAQPQRHGHTPPMSWEARLKAIKTTQRVIVRFADYMKCNRPLNRDDYPILKFD